MQEHTHTHIPIMGEIIERETKRTNSIIQNWFLENINKIAKSVAKLTKRK